MVVEEGDSIIAGSLIAKTPRQAAKTRDITGGLPRVAELFEARIPKDGSEISKIDGVVDFDAGLRDPDHPSRLLPAYDNGDHLHPSDSGYNRMGDIVDLSLFD